MARWPRVPAPIPSSLRVGHATYSVAVDTAQIHEANTDAGSNLAGFSNGASQRIVLREDNAPDYQAETLLHEVLHQCLRVSSCRPDDDSKAGLPDVEERAVAAMAGPLLAVLRDNPGLVAYLTAGA